MIRATESAVIRETVIRGNMVKQAVQAAKSITYSVSEKSVAAVTKKGAVKGKKAGSAVVKAKVTLKNGKTKTVRMKIKVK